MILFMWVSCHNIAYFCINILAPLLLYIIVPTLMLVAGTGVSVFSLHPGVVQSDLWRHQHPCVQVAVKIFRIFTKTTVEGAQTTIYCAVQPGLESQSGGYFRYLQISTLQLQYKSSQSSGFMLLGILIFIHFKYAFICFFLQYM